MKKTKILVTSDDGIDAEGFKSLITYLASRKDLELIAVVPEDTQSARSMAITLGSPVAIKKVKIKGCSRAWCVSGTAVDCIKLAMGPLKSGPYHAVVAGINHGWNCGEDMHYSSTVASALCASKMNIPALALSCESLPFRKSDFPKTIDLLSTIWTPLFKLMRSVKGSFVNVNFPLHCRGFSITSPSSKSLIHENWKKKNGGWELIGIPSKELHGGNSDADAVRAGRISVSVLNGHFKDAADHSGKKHG